MKKIVPLLFFIYTFSSYAIAQTTDPFAAKLAALDSYTNKNAPEKVYLHLDRPYYFAGDTIWFKGYVVNARTSAPSQKSGILYVELISGKTIIKKRVVQLTGGFGWGDIALPDTLSTGNYRIRAYTQWMRNWPSEFFFDRTIKIGGVEQGRLLAKPIYNYTGNQLTSADISFTDRKNVAQIQLPVSYTLSFGDKQTQTIKATTNNEGKLHINLPLDKIGKAEKGEITVLATMADKKTISKTFAFELQNDNIDLQFFPEGGQLVTGLPARIAYKAIASNGLGIDVSGSITDQEGAVMANLENSYLGMGAFYLTPQKDAVYTAKIKTATGREITFELPKAVSSGYSLQISQKDSTEIAIKVMVSEDLVGKGILHLVAQRNGEIFSDMLLNEPTQLNSLKLKTDSLPVGTLLFTLFGADGLSVCERLVFVNKKPDEIDLQIEKLDSVYAPRQKIDINLLASHNGKPVQGSFSVAVTNASVAIPDEAAEGNILTTLLLTAELAGYVEKPNYYLMESDSAARARLDNLLLTQGWRKIDWQKLDTAQRLAFEAEKKLQISGRLMRSGKPVAKGKVMLAASGKGFSIGQTTTDNNGRFLFEPAFTDTVGFAIKGTTDKDKTGVYISLDRVAKLVMANAKDSVEAIVSEKRFMELLAKNEERVVQLAKKGLSKGTIMLKEVVIAKNKDEEYVLREIRRLGQKRVQTITEQDLEGYTSILQYLIEHLKVKTSIWTMYNGDRIFILDDATRITYNGEDKIIESNSEYTVIEGKGAKKHLYSIRIIVNGLDFMGSEPDALPIALIKKMDFYYYKAGKDAAATLSIYTKDNDPEWASVRRNTSQLASFYKQGFSIPRSFYSPKYNVAAKEKYDARTTVFWAPHLGIDDQGRLGFNYYNTDEIGEYRVLMEGMGLDGRLMRKVLQYVVQ